MQEAVYHININHVREELRTDCSPKSDFSPLHNYLSLAAINGPMIIT